METAPPALAPISRTASASNHDDSGPAPPRSLTGAVREGCLRRDWPSWTEQCEQFGVGADEVVREGTNYLDAFTAGRDDSGLTAAAMEAWAAGWLLGADVARRVWTADGGDEGFIGRVTESAVTSWIDAGFTPVDQRRIGPEGVAVLRAGCATAVERGRRTAV